MFHRNLLSVQHISNENNKKGYHTSFKCCTILLLLRCLFLYYKTPQNLCMAFDRHLFSARHGFCHSRYGKTLSLIFEEVWDLNQAVFKAFSECYWDFSLKSCQRDDNSDQLNVDICSDSKSLIKIKSCCFRTERKKCGKNFFKTCSYYE